MQNSQILATVGCVMVLGAAGLEYALGPMAVAQPRRLPVEAFPARLGDWRGGEILPVDPDIQARLPTAKIMERTYMDSRGRSADVMLVTASDSLDIHNPLDCFPSQGWKLSNNRAASLNGQPVSVMDAQQDEQRMSVVYWRTGYYDPPASPSALVRRVYALRQRVVGRKEGESLFVRVMVPADSSGGQTLMQLAGQILPPVQALVAAGAARGPERPGRA
jgi:EpsI family protein